MSMTGCCHGGLYRSWVVSYEWCGPFRNDELSALHAAGFGDPVREHDWQAQLQRYSLGWVCARDGAGLAGFVNVAWDGGSHAFILDTVVAARLRHQGAGTRLVALAAEQAQLAGCAWLHVDFETELGPFYWDSCGFRPTSAGLIAL
jgi:ribosomal protein S18 acetylase RimI-like enzyme